MERQGGEKRNTEMKGILAYWNDLFLSFDCIWKLIFKYLFVTKAVGKTILKLAKLIYIVTHHLGSTYLLSEENFCVHMQFSYHFIYLFILIKLVEL